MKIKSADLKTNFLFKSFAAFSAFRVVKNDCGLDAFLSYSRHEGVLAIGRLVVSLFRRCITFFQRVQVVQ